VTYNGKSAAIGQRSTLTGALVLASRSEVNRGEWKRFSNEPFEVKPVGSVAYKLALVAAGLADATWTLTPKNEWDVAAGVALMNAAGGTAYLLGGDRPSFNNQDPLISGLIAHPTSLRDAVGATLDL
jgi:myo-inositol-1(or 4)-monophosphatase